METVNPTIDYDKMWDQVYGDLQDIGPVHRHMKRLLRSMLRGLRYESVLDVGCGMGHNLPLLTKGRQLKKIGGLDISGQAIEQVARRQDGVFEVADVQTEKLDETFDLVFSALLLEHVDDDLAALKNMRAMTDKYLLVTTMAGDFERYKAWDQQVGHVRNYQPGELEAKLEQAGFQVQKAIYWGFPFYSPLTRLLQNHMKAQSEYNSLTRFIAKSMYSLFFLNSSHKGDLLIILAKPAEVAGASQSEKTSQK